ncbi:SLBB domain-containing protein [Silvimonas sp.]|uniref:SLBB domain-containing protein n=1 Tax=Silvimonas sp. TaxID=2650811 RepID=UPI00284B611F|nr:SLBB domain-containing protein [Silvimonas sp.]MDR3430276.1 SLBB domain-containing protein [Silvimonas sp.]
MDSNAVSALAAAALGQNGGASAGAGAAAAGGASATSVIPPITPVSIASAAPAQPSSSAWDAKGIDIAAAERLKPPAEPGEYETWLRVVTGRPLKRYGADLLVAPARDFSVPVTSAIPPDYALNIGDTVAISLTGSVEGSARFVIDRDGRIYLPNVGSVSLAGVLYRDLKERVADAIGHKYRGYDVSVSVAALHGVRVYVTGFANNPGSYTVSSLSTLANVVLAAGGPSAGGSFRSVKLYRNGHEVVDFDLYQLLRKGDRTEDPLVKSEDVLFIPPVGRQVAVVGSVNEEAIYEAKPGENLEDVLKLAGGTTNLADSSRIILYRLSDRDTVGSRQVDREQARTEPVAAGDILQILPQGSLIRPQERQQVVVRIEGEVNKPGNYFVAPGTSMSEVVTMAGGLSSRAYPFSTVFSRVSVRQQQMENYHEALDQMEQALTIAPLTTSSLQDAAERQSQLTAAKSFIDKLRQREPDGRLVLDLSPDSTTLSGNIVLENNDHIFVPAKMHTVGVFGAVFRQASFLLDDAQHLHVKDYIDQAGGPIRGADIGNVFVVRANGSVLSRKRGAMAAPVSPGDTIFVPIKTHSTSVLTKLLNFSTLLFQFGVTAAAVSAIK